MPRKTKRSSAPRRWSHQVMARSDALDLEKGVFSLNSPAGIARSLKRSADRSRRRKASPFQSAMSMLNFYINRGGRNLPAHRKKLLNEAKGELRRLYGKSPKRGTASGKRAAEKPSKPPSRRKAVR